MPARVHCKAKNARLTRIQLVERRFPVFVDDHLDAAPAYYLEDFRFAAAPLAGGSFPKND